MTLSYSAPTPELAIELDEVRADAASLVEVFSQLNAPLPKDFPRDAVIELATALHHLPSGTARGCLRPLNEAQSQLATIRSQFIRHDHTDAAWEIDNPPQFRGEVLDQRLRGLMSSVSTALQTANRLASEEPDPEAPELGVEPLQDNSTAQLIDKTARAQKELEGEKDELSSLQIRSEPADTLSRRLTDVAVLNQLSRGELRLPRVVAARLRRIAVALRDYPTLLRKAAELVTAGTHFADYAHNKWSELETRIFEAGTSTVREVAEDLSNYARRLDANRKINDTPPQKPPQDFDLEEATRLIHAGTLPPAHWRQHIEHLPLRSRRLKSLAPLAGLSNLRELNRVSVKVGDIAPISDLASLEELNLSFTQISDIGPLHRLKRLRRLSLMGTRISDLAPLTDLASLEHLDLDGTYITDLSPIRQLKRLKTLDLRGTKTTSLAPIAELNELRSLFLTGTSVVDLSSLSKLTNLRFLSVDKTKVSDLTPLSKLSKLSRLVLSETDVVDLSILAHMKELESLFIDNTGIHDLSPLAQLTSLRFLHFSGTLVLDLGPLSKLLGLNSVHFARTGISDLSPLSNHPHLWFLDFEETPVSDITPLLTVPSLGSLQLAKTKVHDLAVLSQLPRLRSLSISIEQVASVPPEVKARSINITAR